jgi:ubiquinone biosynthesis protein COQ9
VADTRERIVDAALELAEARSWEAVRLHDVAAALEIGLEDVRVHFREKEDVAEAWFDRADRALLEHAASAEIQALPAGERLHPVMMAWLDALHAHRRVTRQMIAGKLEPGHLHVQIPALMRISRTVQWMREAAGRDATYLRRAAEETLTTGLYLTTFVYWMYDDSAGSQRTRRLLAGLLRTAGKYVGGNEPQPTGSGLRSAIVDNRAGKAPTE